MLLNLQIDMLSTIFDKIGKKQVLKLLEEKLLDYLKILRANWLKIINQLLKINNITNSQTILFIII